MNSLTLTCSTRGFHASTIVYGKLSVPSKSTRSFTTTLKKLFSGPPAIIEKQGRVLILGSGWGGFTLKNQLDKDMFNTAIISPRNHFTFTPLLASTSVGTLELRSAIEPLRTGASDCEFFQAIATSIDFEKKQVLCKSTLNNESFPVEYDKLVIACGGEPNTFGVPGVEEHACFLKEISHARTIRQKLIKSRSNNYIDIHGQLDFEIAAQPTTSDQERRRLLHFVVVGGGPTGIEFSGELFDFIKDDLDKKYPELASKVQLTIYDVAPKILTMFSDCITTYVTTMFGVRGIRIHTGKSVEKLEEKELVLKGGERVPYGLLLWSTGIKPVKVIDQLDVSKDRMKRIVTDDYLRVLDSNNNIIPDVFAIGDCASIKSNPLPCTAQVAKQKAEYLGKVINGGSVSKLTHAFQYQHGGSMAYVGGYKAVVDSKSLGIFRGRLGWLIWRAAYLSMADSMRNKIKIPTYWVLTWMLGRETSQFK